MYFQHSGREEETEIEPVRGKARPRKPLSNLRSGSISLFGRLRRSEKSNLHDTATNSMSDSDPTNPEQPSRPLRRLELIVCHALPPATHRRRQLRGVSRDDPCLRSACYKRTYSAQPLYRFLLSRGTKHQRPFRGHDLERVFVVRPSPLTARVRRLRLVSAFPQSRRMLGNIVI
jgi:hypothetical protein